MVNRIKVDIGHGIKRHVMPPTNWEKYRWEFMRRNSEYKRDYAEKKFNRRTICPNFKTHDQSFSFQAANQCSQSCVYAAISPKTINV